MTNYGAYRMIGGLNLLAKRGHRPAAVGKMEVAGDQVYAMHLQGRHQEINDYCMFDTLDTYFIFLRTRVLVGEMSAEQEEQLARRARAWLAEKIVILPALRAISKRANGRRLRRIHNGRQPFRSSRRRSPNPEASPTVQVNGIDR